MLAALFALGLISLLAGVLLTWGNRRFAPDEDSLEIAINTLLPQTQCAQCGYPGCRPYAQAIAHGEAEINLCPPGGQETVAKLASLLGREQPALARTNDPSRVAWIAEAECIGCTLCIKACPVDAIIGAPRHMHTVIKALCTGCELCVEPCPVDCIKMTQTPVALAHWKWPAPGTACK